MKVSNRVAVITGAGSGIGRATAHSLAQRGCHMALADIDLAGLKETALMLGHMGVRVTTHALDVADREAVRTLPARVLDAHKRVDLLVNNAGVALGGSFEQVSEEDFEWLMDVNFNGVVRMTRAFLPLLRQSDEARIVNVSSIYGIVSPPGQSAYSASKFAVRGFSNALRHELDGSTVGVSVVHPGGVATAIARNARVPQGTPEDETMRGRELAEKLLRLPPELAGEIIARGIEERQSRILVGTDAKVVSILERLLPVNYWRILKKATAR
jgi:NADP-dependent 3-hydroxy acid dehydrogenase YdfG